MSFCLLYAHPGSSAATRTRPDSYSPRAFVSSHSRKLANAQTTRSVADPFSSFVTQNLQSICSLCHRNPRFFIKIGDPIPLQIHESCHSPRPMPKAVFVSADCGTAKDLNAKISTIPIEYCKNYIV